MDSDDVAVRRPGVGAHSQTPRTGPARGEERSGAAEASLLRHDLSQPLATMTLLVEAIADQDLPADVATALSQISHETQWMRRLLHGAEGSELVRRVDMGDVVAGSCLAPSSAAYELHLDRLGCTHVVVDPIGLERATRNLLDNAIRAVGTGGRIDVRVWPTDRQAVLEVADSGPGFGHLEPQHGHGLVSVRRFLQRFGGEVVCGTSSLGGALVSLYLPLAPGW